MHSLSSLALKTAAIALCLFFSNTTLRAHDGGTTGFSAITIDRNMVRYELTLSSIPASALAKEMGVGMVGVQPNYEPLARAIATHIHMSGDGFKCEAGAYQVKPPRPNVVSVSAFADFVCRDEIHTLTIRDDLYDVLGDELHTLAKIEWHSGSQQFAFGPDARQTHIVIAAPSTNVEDHNDSDSNFSKAKGAGSFFTLGIKHILTGYDHLIFLLALMLCGGSLLSLLKIVTGFTLAHSLTLALATFDIVVLPSRWVEMAIALSIAYVATENLLPRYAISRRWAVSFVFGAIHGFGFASLLHEAGLQDANLLWSLLNFNLGVEFGQMAIVALALPILMRMRGSRWENKVVKGLSVAILLLGLALFVQRLLV